MKAPRASLVPAIAFLAVFALSCDSNRESVSGLDGFSPTLPTFKVDCTERPGHPQCDGDGGSGGSSGADSDLTLAGGYDAATASADIEADNKKWLTVTSEGLTGSSGLTVAIDFTNTEAAASADFGAVCTGDNLTAFLVDPTARAADFGLQIIKQSVLEGVRDPRNWMRVRRSEDDTTYPRVDLNFSTGDDHPDALVTLRAGDDIDSGERQFTFSEGAVRVSQRINTTTSFHMTCDQAAGDEVIVTIAPS